MPENIPPSLIKIKVSVKTPCCLVQFEDFKIPFTDYIGALSYVFNVSPDNITYKIL